MKRIVIYPGRFQPFGPHHAKTYNWLCTHFGRENVYVVSSNVVDEKSPLTFDEKVPFMRKFGVLPTNIYQVSNPYRAVELTSEFDAKTTAIIFIYGEKDANRIRFELEDGSPSYFQPYYGQKQLNPLYVNGYAMEAPTVKINHEGSEINGTYLRNRLPSTTQDEFEALMGWYERDLHDLLKMRCGKTIEKNIENNIESVNENAEMKRILLEGSITKTQLQRIEQYADRLFKEYGIDVEFQNLYKGTHFFQRLNDPRNGKDITADELRMLFKKVSQRYGDKISKMNPNAEAVMRDMETDINLPFIIKYDSKTRELDLIPKTIMRKRDFKSPDPFLSVESKTINEQSDTSKYTKHIQHPFEDPNLTFKQLAAMIKVLCENPESLNPVLKVDGQNLQVTIKDGKLLASRNKMSTMSPMSVDEMVDKFKVGEVKEVFRFAFELLESWLVGKYDVIFENGNVFLNCELCFPQTTNVFTYTPRIYIHGTIKYDGLGNVVSRSSKVPLQLPTTIGSVKIESTPKFQMKPVTDIYSKFYHDLSKMMNAEGLSVEHKISDLKNSESLKNLIFKVGNIIICKNAPENQPEVERIKGRLTKIDLQMASNPDETLRVKYKAFRDRFERLGGIKSIQPIEGFVFGWGGSQYKITGSFNPINGMLGILKYSKR